MLHLSKINNESSFLWVELHGKQSGLQSAQTLHTSLINVQETVSQKSMVFGMIYTDSTYTDMSMVWSE